MFLAWLIGNFMSGKVLPTFMIPRKNTSGIPGFTLVELLIVLAVVIVLIAMIFPAVGSAQYKVREFRSLHNMSKITAGLLSFAAENNSQLPSQSITGDNGNPPTWDAQILPYLGFEHADGYSGGSVTSGSPLKTLDIFRCPFDSRKPTDTFHPRSYATTGVAVYPPAAGIPNYGFPDRPYGEGLRLQQVRKPARLVILTRLRSDCEYDAITVGVHAWTAYDGPSWGDPNDLAWRMFKKIGKYGRIPYGFADGHVSFIDRMENKEYSPASWTRAKDQQ